jgi:ferric-dicitrate binding protein FerR (iron transport regulator)
VYPKAFAAAERHISLEGEAFFEVTHNEKQPFIIDAQNAQVKVLGTSFDVRCSEKSAFVTVVTGRVQFSDKNDNSKAVILTPGEKGSLQHNDISKENANANNYLYWETGELNFQDQPLAAVVKEISQVMQETIVLDTKMAQEKQQQIVSIHFNNQTTEQMLNELCLITQCNWTKQNNTYLITSK